ncbi:hypothetical protein P3T25_009753 [Paraburkholderia sp. GAS32]
MWVRPLISTRDEGRRDFDARRRVLALDRPGASLRAYTKELRRFLRWVGIWAHLGLMAANPWKAAMDPIILERDELKKCATHCQVAYGKQSRASWISDVGRLQQSNGK